MDKAPLDALSVQVSSNVQSRLFATQHTQSTPRHIDPGYDGADIDDTRLASFGGGLDEQRSKGLSDSQQAPDIDLEQLSALVEVGVEQGTLVSGSRIVDKVVEATAGQLGDLTGGGADRGLVGDVELDDLDARESAQVLDLGQVPCRREDTEAPLVKLLGEGEADAALAAAGDEYGALLFRVRHHDSVTKLSV